MEIKEVVRKLVSGYRTNDPFRIAECRNIIVFNEPLGNILGYFHTSKRTRMIHINSCLDVKMRKFVCAHELGHAVLHPKVNTPFLRRNTLYSINKIEREANEFAIELLIPDDVLRDMTDETVTVCEIAVQYGIPHDLVRLKKLGGACNRIKSIGCISRPIITGGAIHAEY